MLGKTWKESRTIWIGVLEGVIGALGLLATFAEAGDFTAPAIILLVSGVLKIVMRLITSEPIV